MKIFTAAEIREIDRVTTEKYGVPTLQLMENAGSAVAEFVAKNFPHASSIFVICGKGNNGGDGFVAARKLLDAGKQVSVVLLAEPQELRGDAKDMFSRFKEKAIVAMTDLELEKVDLTSADLIVDAILGTGARLPVEGLYAMAIERMNSSGAPIVAVDVPSGADADAQRRGPGVVAKSAAIVTFTALKPAHVFQFGDVPTVVRDIGTPTEAVLSRSDLHLVTPYDFAKVLAARDADSNKGDFGHVLVIGGSLGKAGAPAMTGLAALRAGAGLVSVAIPKSLLPTVAGFAPELMTEALPETAQGTVSILALDSTRKLVAGKSVMAIGPGLSQERETAQFVRALVDRSETPTVVDADGLNAFQGHSEYLHGKVRPLIITPHPGEMSRLTGLTVAEVQRDRIGIAQKFAREHEAYVVLKGDHTVIAEPEGRVWINNTGNPGMATAGTGDVLTGIVAGMIAQNSSDIATAIIAAVYLHGCAGDIARDEVGEASLIATDLIGALPAAFIRAKALLVTDIL